MSLKGLCEAVDRRRVRDSMPWRCVGSRRMARLLGWSRIEEGEGDDGEAGDKVAEGEGGEG